jgi:hypothetical protein
LALVVYSFYYSESGLQVTDNRMEFVSRWRLLSL